MTAEKTEDTPLAFEDLRISKQTYGAHAGKLTCNVRARGYNTQLDVVVPEDITGHIMQLIAPIIAEQVAKSLMSVAEDHLLITATQDVPVIEGETQDVAP